MEELCSARTQEEVVRISATLAQKACNVDSISIVLRLLRESGKVSHQTAVQGVYQQMMAGRIAQMLRIRLRLDYECVPEISANKYALNIRFTTHEFRQRPRVIESDVDFELTFCNL